MENLALLLLFGSFEVSGYFLNMQYMI